MRCPKCGAENPPGTLFCEECDWRMDQKASSADKARNPSMFAAASLIIGLASLAAWFAGQGVAAVAAGALGMVVGGYSMNLPRYVECSKALCMALAGLGIMLSIIGFIFGLSGVSGQ